MTAAEAQKKITQEEMDVIQKKIKGEGKQVYFNPDKPDGCDEEEDNGETYKGIGHDKKAPGKVEIKSSYGATVLEAYGM